MNKDLLHELFDYKDNELIWKEDRYSKKVKGNIAGFINKKGYRIIKINGNPYKAHRLIWAYHYESIPSNLQIDHINRIKHDNNIENLRLVTSQENNWNTNAKGCSQRKKSKRWQAYIQVNDKLKHLGFFDNEEEAHQTYLNAKAKHHRIELH